MRTSHGYRTFLFPLFILALALPASGQEEVPAADRRRPEIVDRAIAFHGGDSYRGTHTELDLCSKAGCTHLSVLRDGDRYDYTVTEKVPAQGDTPEQERKVRATNDTVERWVDGKPVPVPAEETQRWRDFVSAKVYFCFLPYPLSDDSVYFQDLGLETWGERKLHKVKVTFAAGSSTDASDEYLYWFDPESARLEQFAYSFEGRPGGLRFRKNFDFERVGGILFFDQKNLGAPGDELRVDQVTPAFVETMEHVSNVRLDNIRVLAIR